MTTRTGPRAAVLPALCLVALTALGALLGGCGSGDAEPASATDSASETSSGTPTDPASDPTTDPVEPTTEVTTPAPPAIPAGTPDCSAVWSAGATLPGGYQGCADGDVYVKADRLGCESGQAITRYADQFYGVAGGLIYEGTSPLIDDPDYAEMVAGCRA
ncbi:hypothetical protein [Nocardioides sp.]|uniref:hypothetical protein n=1 Tax=Nocardioides sp. TaxID=35761 RepID=UPI0027199565|nr:hypothetical protein [Nocardioides sp.]MDO9456136.1 hypothetical protein [Nocardioides sp.]